MADSAEVSVDCSEAAQVVAEMRLWNGRTSELPTFLRAEFLAVSTLPADDLMIVEVDSGKRDIALRMSGRLSVLMANLRAQRAARDGL
jgi:hypothetical protein